MNPPPAMLNVYYMTASKTTWRMTGPLSIPYLGWMIRGHASGKASVIFFFFILVMACLFSKQNPALPNLMAEQTSGV